MPKTKGSKKKKGEKKEKGFMDIVFGFFLNPENKSPMAKIHQKNKQTEKDIERLKK